MRKLLIFLLKYIPVVQSAGMLLNNILYLLHKYPNICYVIDFIIGNSLSTFILFIICSYVFKFCNWHRILIYGNFINILISYSIYIAYYETDSLIIPIVSISIISITTLISLYFRFCKNDRFCNFSFG